MKKLTIAILLLLIASTLKAQRIQAYVNAGTTLSQIEGDELKGFLHWGITGGVGAIASLGEDNIWSLAVETDYGCRGVRNNRSSSENYYNISLNLHYVDIPVTVFFHDPYGGIQVGAGLTYGRLVAQPHGTISYSPYYFIPDSSDMTFLKNDFSPAIEVRFTVWKNLKLSARYQRSIIPIKKDWTFHMGERTWSNDCYNSAISFRLLWQFGEEDTPTLRHKKKGRR